MRARVLAVVAALTVGVVGLVSPASAVTLPPGPAAGSLVSVSPQRIIDTRTGLGNPGSAPGAIPAGGTLTVAVADSNTDVSAVVVNVTVTQPDTFGFITAFPGGTTRPLASNVDFGAGETVPNLSVVPVGADGTISFYNGSGGNVHLVVDISGYYLGGTPAGAGALHPLTPARLLDTRIGTGAPQGFVAAGDTLSLAVAGNGGVPASGVAAVVLNLTVTQPQAPGFLTAYGAGTSQPLASNLNFQPGQTVANLVVVPVGSGGNVALFNGSSGGVHLVADVFGYILGGSPTAAGAMTSLTPTRLLDTRNGTGIAAGQIAANGVAALQVTGHAGVPLTGVSAVVLNVTVTSPGTFGFITAYGHDTNLPLASNLNFGPNQTVPNLVVVPVGSDGEVSLYNGSAAGVDLVADIAGYFLSGGGVLMSSGTGLSGQLGNGVNADNRVPGLVNGLTGVTAVATKGAFGLALDADGFVWGWGKNTDGEFANGAAGDPMNRPVLLDLSMPAKAIAAGTHTGYALATDGTVWAWGRGTDGEMGNGTTPAIGTPTQVTGLTNVTAIAATGFAAFALKADGTVWSWGANGAGELGGGAVGPDRSTALQIAGLSGITAIAGGLGTGYALKSDGTVWSWGGGAHGALGTGVTTDGASPTQITGLTGITAIAAATYNGYALKNDGTVSAWGYGPDGELGDGVALDPNRESDTPVQVQGVTNAVGIGAGLYTAYAILTDKTVVGWGYAGVETPILGSDHTSPTEVPVPVSGLANVSAIVAGEALYALVDLP